MINRKFILLILAFVNFTHIVDSMLIMPLGDIFIELFDLEAKEYSWLVGAYAIAAFVSSCFGIVILDRFDRKKALLIAYTGFAIGTFLCAFSNSFEMLLALRFLTGLFGGVIGAVVLSIVSDLYKFSERGTAMGILMAAFSAASALGIPIGLYLAAKGTWQWPFMIIGIFGILVSTVILIYFPKMTQHREESNQKISFSLPFLKIFRDKNQINALVAGFFLVFGHFLIIPFISPFLIKNVGLSQIQISYQFFFGGLATIVTGPLVGRLTDKFGVKKVFLTTMLLSFIPTVLITQMPISSVLYAICITTLFFIFASGRMIPPQTLITAAAPPENRGSFMSFKSALQQFGIFCASIISGLIVVINENGTYDNYHLVGYLAIVMCLFTIVLIFRLKVARGN